MPTSPANELQLLAAKQAVVPVFLIGRFDQCGEHHFTGDRGTNAEQLEDRVTVEHHGLERLIDARTWTIGPRQRRNRTAAEESPAATTARRVDNICSRRRTLCYRGLCGAP